MRSNWAMMTSRITPPAEEGVEVDGAEKARGVVVLVRGRFG